MEASAGVKVAVWGCGHGELDQLYSSIEELDRKSNDGARTELLLCCGDFQAIRNEKDLSTMACPPKYLCMKSFYKYYSGEKVAPILTIFVGGNHEAATHFKELIYGGWVAPNIYFLGSSGVVNYRGIRIAGISGIYKRYNYYEGYYEHAPYSDSSIHSICHCREFDYFKLRHLNIAKSGIDIMLSHDWPRNITKYGDEAALLRTKSFFAEECAKNELGNPASEALLFTMKPSYWFSGHLHVKFAAVVHHASEDLSDDKDLHVTKFLALDKCLPSRQYLQILQISPTTSDEKVRNLRRLCYDVEWLAILRKVHSLTPRHRSENIRLPSTCEYVTPDEIAAVASLFPSPPEIPLNFTATVNPYRPLYPGAENYPINGILPYPTADCGNPQTDFLLQVLNLPHVITVPYVPEMPFSEQDWGRSNSAEVLDSNEIVI
jgi:lariat debranching enzyme